MQKQNDRRHGLNKLIGKTIKKKKGKKYTIEMSQEKSSNKLKIVAQICKNFRISNVK